MRDYDRSALRKTHQKELGMLFDAFGKHISHEVRNDVNTQLVDKHIRHMYEEHIRAHTDDFSLKLLQPCYKPNHVINHYFDQIYVLNLDCRPDRMDHMREQLHRLGIYNYCRFPALYGKEEPHISEWQKYMKVPMSKLERTKYQRKGIASAGSWAILKSMYLMIRDAQANNHQRFLVLQDDLLFHKDFHKQFETLIKQDGLLTREGGGAAHPQWKLLYIGATQHAWPHTTFNRSHLYYHPNGTADGAFGVAIDKSVYQELINEILEFDLPVDSGALKAIQKRYPKECIVAFPNLVIADIRDSDLRGYRDLETFSKKFRWDLENYHIVDALAPAPDKMRALRTERTLSTEW